MSPTGPLLSYGLLKMTKHCNEKPVQNKSVLVIFFMLLHDGLDNYTTVRNMEIISFVSTLKSMSFEITQHRQTFRFLPPRYCANAVSATAILSVCLSVTLKL